MTDGETGERLPDLPEILADDSKWSGRGRRFDFKKGRGKQLKVKVLQACWETVTGKHPVRVVLLEDPRGEWRKEALVSTNPNLCDWEIVLGYCKRWTVEVAFAESKGLLGLHDPMVWTKKSVERTAPMAWYTGMLVLLWYASEGIEEPTATRHRPYYRKRGITFSDMLATMRMAIWEDRLGRIADKDPAERETHRWMLEYIATAA